MRKIYSLLAAIALTLIGTGNAKAQEVYWSTDFSSVPTGMTYSVINGSVDISSGVLSLSQGGGSGNRVIDVAFSDESFNAHNSFSFEFDWGGACSNQNPSTMTVTSDAVGTMLTISWEKYATTASIADAAGNILTSALPIDGYKKATPTNLSHFVINVNNLGAYLTVTNGGTTFVDNKRISAQGHITGFGGALGRAVSYAALDNITLSEFADADVSTVAEYTIKFVDGEGNTIKDDQVDNGTIGENIELDGSYTANFWVDETKYIYVSDNSASVVVAEDGSSVVTVIFRQAETWNYTVNNNLGNIITSGSVVEGESAIFAYPQYIEIDGTLFSTSTRNATGDGYYLYKITPTQDGEELTINYTEDIANIAYFAEAEDIEGATANNGNNTNIRCSNAYGAYFENDVTITTLPAGTYKVTTQVWGNSGATFTINAGETTILEAATVGYLNTYTSEEFTLTEETDIVIPAAGSNGKVIDWIYIQEIPAIYNYSVVTNLGTTITSGSLSAGESVTFSYPEYILQGDLLNRTSLRNATGDGYYKYTLTPQQDGEELVIEYEPAIENVVYFSEAEDIIGASVNDRNNTDIRCSNALGAIFPEDVTITTLPAGAYKIGAQVWGNAGVTFNIIAGEETVLEAATVGYLNAYSAEFVLTEEADIVIPAAGSNGKVLDWIYIVRLGDVPTFDVNISSVGYATFYDSKYSYTIPTGVTAKTYALAEDGITLNESKVYGEGEVLPADEAVVLEGAQGTYTFDYAPATEEVKDENNVLKGTDEETTLDEVGYKYYVLSVKGGDPATVGFYFQNEDGTSLTNGEHKAYLQVPAAAEAKAFYALGGEATAINAVSTVEENSNEMFDLQGRRVANPVKGMYIMNGKKVLVK